MLDAERARHGPDAATGDRLRARLDASIGGLPGGPSGSGAGGGGAGSALRYLAVAAASLAVGAGGGVLLDRRWRAPPPPQIVYVDRIVSPPVPPASVSVEATVSATSTAPPATPSAPVRDPGRDRDRDLAAERALLEVARTALAQRDGAAALTSLDRHAQRFPSGQLREEREALAVQALASQGRATEARARAERFKKAYPASMFTPVVDQATTRPR
jgi:hypothetical protein